MSERVRGGLVVCGVLLLVVAVAFAMRLPWAVDVWPFKYTDRISFYFIASFVAAGGASLLYCGLTRDGRAVVGAAIDAVVIGGAVTVMAWSVAGWGFRIAGVGLVATGCVAAWWFRRFAWRDARPTPRVVRVSFAVFVVALVAVGVPLAMGSQKVLPWVVTPEVARLYGWAFLAASTYFIYGLVVPVWSNAAGQLLSFLAYDLVLLVPFVPYFGEVPPERMVNHVAYVAVVVGSGVLAVVYCFVLPRTRVWGRGAVEGAGTVMKT